MNWKIIVGALLIFGAVSELFSVYKDYVSGKVKSWPAGVEIGAALVVAVGIFLIRKGMKKSEGLS